MQVPPKWRDLFFYTNRVNIEQFRKAILYHGKCDIRSGQRRLY